MTRFSHNPFSAQLDVIATIKDRVIQSAIKGDIDDTTDHDLTDALASAIEAGVDINDLSNASGLPVGEIERRVAA